MREHNEALQRALAQLRDELDEFNTADRVITVANDEGRDPRDNEYDSRDRLALEVARSAGALMELLDAEPPAGDADEVQATSVADLALIVNRLLADGEGDRTLVYLPPEMNSSGEPEVWAVTDEVDDAVPGLLYVATVDVTEQPADA